MNEAEELTKEMDSAYLNRVTTRQLQRARKILHGPNSQSHW